MSEIGVAIMTSAATLAGGSIAIVAATFAQDRARLHRERTIAAALLEDLDRIEPILPAPRGGATMTLYSPNELLAIHPWVRPLIVELAGRDATLVGALMTLEPMLSDQQNRVGAAQSTDIALERQRSEIRDREALIEAPDRQAARKENLAHLGSALEYLPVLEAQHAEAMASWRVVDAKLRGHIGGIRARLSAIVRAPIAKFPWPTSEEFSPQRWNPE